MHQSVEQDKQAAGTLAPREDHDDGHEPRIIAWNKQRPQRHKATPEEIVEKATDSCARSSSEYVTRAHKQTAWKVVLGMNWRWDTGTQTLVRATSF